MVVVVVGDAKVRQCDVVELVSTGSSASKELIMGRSFSNFDHSALKKHQNMFPVSVVPRYSRSV